MNLDTWFTLPTAEWAGSLVGLSLAVVSAAAAVFSSVHLAWIAELTKATDETSGEDGKTLLTSSSRGARAYDHLKRHRATDPRNRVGWVALFVSAFMTLLGCIAGLQIPKVGWFYTIVPILIAAGVSILAVFAPGRTARRDADTRLREMETELAKAEDEAAAAAAIG